MTAPLVQNALVLLVVAGAVAWLGRRAWRAYIAGRTRRSGACGAGCGCDP